MLENNYYSPILAQFSQAPVERVKMSLNWYLDEFVDVYTYLTEPDHGRNKIDIKIVAIAQYLRHEVIRRSCIINNWWNEYYLTYVLRGGICFISKTQELTLQSQAVHSEWWRRDKLLSQSMEWFLSAKQIAGKIENNSNVYKWSGLRPNHCTLGAVKSSHKLGKAIDIKCLGVSSYSLFDMVKGESELYKSPKPENVIVPSSKTITELPETSFWFKNAELYKRGARRIEHPMDTKGRGGWLHIDLSEKGQPSDWIYVFRAPPTEAK